MAISMTALAGSVLLLGVTSSLQNTDEPYRQAVALGLAQQLLDEVVGGSSMPEIDAYDGLHTFAGLAAAGSLRCTRRGQSPANGYTVAGSP